ncbi:MAG: hypothetical protein CMH57_15300 [Myxococcales bacterium]|nr:hypothetical protein [Myxococcales bacterium]
MNNAITRMDPTACRLRSNGNIALLSALAAIGLMLGAPSESSSQPRVTELLGVTVEDLEEGQGVRLILETRDHVAIPPEAISFRTLRDIVRINVRRARVGRGMSYQTPLKGVETSNRVHKAFLYRHGISAFLRMKVDGSARQAIEGYRVEPAPEGLAILLPLGGPLPAPAGEEDENTITFQDAPDNEGAGEGDTRAKDDAAETTEGEKEDEGDALVAAPAEDPRPTEEGSAQPAAVLTDAPAEASEEPWFGGNVIALLGLLFIAVLVGAALMLGVRSLNLNLDLRRKPHPLASVSSLPAQQTRILARHTIDRQTEILFMELLGEVMALSKTNGSLQLLYRLGPEATTILYEQIGEQIPASATRSAIMAARQATSHEHRSSSSLFQTTPMFETSEDAARHDPNDFGYTLESLSREIHLKAMKESRNTNNSNVTELFQPSPSDTISSTNEPGAFAQWFKRGRAEGGVEDSDLFQVMIEPVPQDLSEVPDESMIDISFVIDEQQQRREQEEKERRRKDRVPAVPPPPDIPRKG